MGTAAAFPDTNRFLGQQYFDSVSPDRPFVLTVCSTFLGRRDLPDGTRAATVTSLLGPGLSGADSGRSEEVLTISFFVLFPEGLEVDT